MHGLGVAKVRGGAHCEENLSPATLDCIAREVAFANKWKYAKYTVYVMKLRSGKYFIGFTQKKF